ncbi:MAG TPA: ATP-binding protein [Flavisolibacter sp.]|nr:ATP-binding protein [Flavisolibacter sp.]
MTIESLTPVTGNESIYLNLFKALSGNSILLRNDAPRYTIVAATSDYAILTGVKIEDLIDNGIFEVFPSNPYDSKDTGANNLKASLDYVVQHKKKQELPVLRYDSVNEVGVFTERYWRSTNAPVLNTAGKVEYIIHTTVDITHLVLAEQKSEAAKSIEKAYNFFMSAPVIIGFLKGDNYIIELANEGLLEVWGRTKEVVGQSLMQAIPELEAQGFKALLDRVRITGQPFFAYEYPITLHRHGKEEVLYFDFVYKPFYEEETIGKASGVISVGHDVTAQVLAKSRAEATQKDADRQRRLYEAINGSIPDLIYVFDLNYRFTYANKALLDMWGSTAEQSIGKGLLENGYEPWHAEMHEREIDQVVATKMPIRGEVSFPHATLGKRVYDYIFVPVFNEIGDVEAVAGTTRDITELKLAQEVLKQSEEELQQKVAERTAELQRTVEELRRSNTNLEEFAYAASHDLKEPIRKIHFFSHRIKDTMSGRMTAEEKRYFERMEGAAKRMATLIDDLLAYSQISIRPRSFEEVNMNQLINLVLEDLDLEIEDKQAIIIVDKLFTIKGHHCQLQQAFQNLISNALKYSKPGVTPRINIACSKMLGKEAGLTLTTEDQQKSFHCISIFDNGIGFEQADAERIFNVFTRLHGMAEYKGTGIGLSIVRKVIENHNGYIWAESQPGQGSAFRILLPEDLK